MKLSEAIKKGSEMSLGTAIIKCNDQDRLSREEIADWVESLERNGQI